MCVAGGADSSVTGFSGKCKADAMMREELDFKVAAITSTVFAAVTLIDLHDVLEVVMMSVMVIYTGHRYWRFLTDKTKKD